MYIHTYPQQYDKKPNINIYDRIWFAVEGGGSAPKCLPLDPCREFPSEPTRALSFGP